MNCGCSFERPWIKIRPLHWHEAAARHKSGAYLFERVPAINASMGAECRIEEFTCLRTGWHKSSTCVFKQSFNLRIHCGWLLDQRLCRRSADSVRPTRCQHDSWPDRTSRMPTNEFVRRFFSRGSPKSVHSLLG